MNTIWHTFKQPFFVLAPMDDVTDTVFRQLVQSWAAPDLLFTEFASADGLQSNGRNAVMKKLHKVDSEGPMIAQIWGMRPEAYRKTATEIADMGFAGLDINMGCPVKKVIKMGACSALQQNRPLAAELIQAAKDGVAGRIPVSVKTRIGFSKVDLSWIEFLLQQDIAALSVHGRTTKEMSKVPMHWEVFPEIVAMRDRIAPDTVLVGNGDVMSHAEGLEKAQEYGLDGIMIGRGVFHDPYVFAQQSPWAGKSREERIAHYRQHIELFVATWPQANPSMLKKFCKVYINGFDGASDMRSSIMDTKTPKEMLAVLHS